MSTAWVLGGFDSFWDWSCLPIHAAYTKATTSFPFRVFVLFGFEKIPECKLALLREKSILLEDASYVLDRVKLEVDGLRKLLPTGPAGDYEYLCFMRWLVIDKILAGEAFIQCDLDLFFQLSLDQIAFLFEGKSGTFSSPCLTSVGSKDWIEEFKRELRVFVKSPEEFQESIGYGGNVYRKNIGSDQDFTQALEKVGILQVSVNLLHRDFAIFNNPLYPYCPEIDKPYEFSDVGGIDYIGSKPVLFWHFQNDFSRYLARFELVSRVSERLKIPVVGRIGNPIAQLNPSPENIAFIALETQSFEVEQLRHTDKILNSPELDKVVTSLNRSKTARYFLVDRSFRALFANALWWEPGVFI